MHPVILTEIATQHILEMQAEAARTARARGGPQGPVTPPCLAV